MPPRRDSEDGFVLITAIWLLLLCAAIVAVLMLRGNAASTAAEEEARAAQEQLALDAATDTVIADLLLRGSASKWGNTPAEGVVTIGDAAVSIGVTNEAGRFDLNEGDLGTLDLILRRLGYTAAERARFASKLRTIRASKTNITSFAEVQALLAILGSTQDGSCLADFVTIYSALAQPRPGQMPAGLGRALRDTRAQQPLEPGAALRVEARTGGGGTLRSVIRITGAIGEPYVIMDRTAAATCER